MREFRRGERLTEDRLNELVHEVNAARNLTGPGVKRMRDGTIIRPMGRAGAEPTWQWAQITAWGGFLVSVEVRLLDEGGLMYGDPLLITPDAFCDGKYLSCPNVRMILPAALIGDQIRVEQRTGWPGAGWFLHDRTFPAKHFVRITAVGSTSFTGAFLEPVAQTTPPTAGAPNANGATITVNVWGAGLTTCSRSATLATSYPFLVVGQDVMVQFLAGPYAGWWLKGPAPWTCTS